MNNKFDELTKDLAQSVTRRAALKKFGVGLAGMALACFGLADKAEAKGQPRGSHRQSCFNNCMHDCVRRLEANGTPKDQATSLCQNQCGFLCSF